jgi:hypothetical protein
MEKRINTKIDGYVAAFKADIRQKIISLDLDKSKMKELAEFITEYGRLSLEKDDFVRRKRVKNAIPQNNRCNAKRANGEQCTRRRRDDCEFCGTHYKGTPHGMINCGEALAQECAKQHVELVVEDIGGIVYYLDKSNNVYNTEDVLRGMENPSIVGKLNGETKKIEWN